MDPSTNEAGNRCRMDRVRESGAGDPPTTKGNWPGTPGGRTDKDEGAGGGDPP